MSKFSKLVIWGIDYSGGCLVNWLLTTDLQHMTPRLSDQLNGSTRYHWGPFHLSAFSQRAAWWLLWYTHHLQTSQHLIESEPSFPVSHFQMKGHFSRSLPTPKPPHCPEMNHISTRGPSYHWQEEFLATTDLFLRAELSPTSSEAHSYAKNDRNLKKIMLLGERGTMGWVQRL